MYINYCDFKSSESLSKIQYNEPSSDLIVEKYTGDVTVNDIIENSQLNFFPDVHDIEIIDETNDILEPPKLMEPEPKKMKRDDSVGEFFG